ncbi:MAG: nucleotidyltransferase domain-containing protein [Candidatus Omnitrophota bacterium]
MVRCLFSLSIVITKNITFLKIICYTKNNMVEKSSVPEIVSFIKSEFKAKEVVVFGSYVRNKLTTNSDLDIFVIMDMNRKPYEQAALIRLKVDEKFGVSFPIDIIVRSPHYVEKRLKMGDFFIKDILKEGLRA